MFRNAGVSYLVWKVVIVAYRKPLKLKDIWLDSGLIDNGQWVNNAQKLITPHRFHAMSILLDMDSLIVDISSKDIIIFQSGIESSIREKVISAYEICKNLSEEITDTLSKYRILIVSKSNFVEQHCILFSNGTSVAVIEESKLLNTNDIYHETTHLFALSGFSVIDEGLATFMEDIAPIFSDLEDVAVAQEWLEHKVRYRTNKTNPYVYGAASICAALLTGGIEGAQHLVRTCQKSSTESKCYILMEESLKKADYLISNREVYKASVNPTDDYFAGRHAQFKAYVRNLIKGDSVNYTYNEWLNIARCSVLLASEPSFYNEFLDKIEKKSKRVPIDIDNVIWLFKISSQIKYVYSHTSQDFFINSSKLLIKELSGRIEDTNVSKDAMIILMYLYYYLPKFAGGSTKEALSLSKIMSNKYGIVIQEFKYINHKSE